MFAVLAALVWLLELLHVQLGDVNMTVLGLFLFALHFIIPWTPWPTHRPGPAQG